MDSGQCFNACLPSSVYTCMSEVSSCFSFLLFSCKIVIYLVTRLDRIMIEQTEQTGQKQHIRGRTCMKNKFLKSLKTEATDECSAEEAIWQEQCPKLIFQNGGGVPSLNALHRWDLYTLEGILMLLVSYRCYLSYFFLRLYFIALFELLPFSELLLCLSPSPLFVIISLNFISVLSPSM